jgi:outer membrane lipoprotein-sorting protein
MLVATLLLAAMVNGETDKDAEKAFQEMSATLTKAKSFACTFEMKMDTPQGKGSFKGRLVVAQGNKVRIEMNGEGGGKTTDLLSVSDGAKVVTVDNKTTQPARDTPKNLAKRVMTGTARGGIFVPMFLAVEVSTDGDKPKETDIEDIIKVSDFRLGKKEEVDGKEAQAVEYLITAASVGNGEKIKATVWIDLKTHVPLKRLLTTKVGDGDKELKVTEIYSKVVVDGKIDVKTFELPK